MSITINLTTRQQYELAYRLQRIEQRVNWRETFDRHTMYLLKGMTAPGIEFAAEESLFQKASHFKAWPCTTRHIKFVLRQSHWREKKRRDAQKADYDAIPF